MAAASESFDIDRMNVTEDVEAGDITGKDDEPRGDGEIEDDAFEFGGDEDEASTSTFDANLQAMDGQWVDGNKACTACVRSQRRFICVELPCVVKNQNKAIETLGGVDGIEKTLSRSGRFELNFRPPDPFCKPAVSNEKPCWNLLIKIRRRKGAGAAENFDGIQFKAEVLGVVDTIYTFDNQCDFQFLPITKSSDGTPAELLSRIIPAMGCEREEYLARDCQLFLPPTMFSRRERPCFYALENDPMTQQTNTQANSLRRKREHGSHIINFDDDVLPTEPHPVALSNVTRFLPNYRATQSYKALRELFEIRPVWSKTACVAHLEEAFELHVKYLLPMISYCFLTGPWRNLWCRFGFDPRNTKEAKNYQVVDYRVRSAYNRDKVERKRQKETCRAYPHASSRSYDASLELESSMTISSALEDKFDAKYMFHPDTLPPYRQMRYQFCDIFEEEVQSKVHENDGKEHRCTERDGWCVPLIADYCRNILNKHVEKLLGT